MKNAESIVLIRQFIEACVRADLDEFASYFCEDAIWWNSPWPPVEGRAAIRETLRIGVGRMTALPWDIRHIVGDGDVVMTVDHFQVGDKRISVPSMGICELRNGRSPHRAIVGISNVRSSTPWLGASKRLTSKPVNWVIS